MIRLILVDDHALIRRGMRDVLSGQAGMEVTGEAANASELLALVATTPCDVLLLDINLPGASGLDILAELRAAGSATRALVVSMYPEDQYAIRALRAGAYGYAIYGHTDARASDEYNMRLSQRRAKSVADVAFDPVADQHATEAEQGHGDRRAGQHVDAGPEELGQRVPHQVHGKAKKNADDQRLRQDRLADLSHQPQPPAIKHEGTQQGAKAVTREAGAPHNRQRAHEGKARPS